MATLRETTIPAAKELRTVIVTGASSGIGAYCARALKAEGWRVLATVRKSEDIGLLEADGIEAFYLDYGEPGSPQALVNLVGDRNAGRIAAPFHKRAPPPGGAGGGFSRVAPPDAGPG